MRTYNEIDQLKPRRCAIMNTHYAIMNIDYADSPKSVHDGAQYALARKPLTPSS